MLFRTWPQGGSNEQQAGASPARCVPRGAARRLRRPAPRGPGGLGLRAGARERSRPVYKSPSHPERWALQGRGRGGDAENDRMDRGWVLCSPCLGRPHPSAWIQLPASAPESQQMMTRVLGPLPATGETWMESWAPGLSLGQPWLVQAFGEQTRSLSLCLFQISSSWCTF